MKKIIVFLFSIILFSSCNDNPPRISISSPTNGQVFEGGDEIQIRATLYDNDALSHEFLKVISSDGDVLIDFEDTTFTDGEYHLENSFVAQSGKEYEIIIEAWGQGSSRKRIVVSAN